MTREEQCRKCVFRSGRREETSTSPLKKKKISTMKTELMYRSRERERERELVSAPQKGKIKEKQIHTNVFRSTNF